MTLKITHKSITTEHVTIFCKKSFDDVKSKLEREIPLLDPRVVEFLRNGDETGVADCESNGPRLFVFLDRDHGALLQIVGRTRKAVQYEIGNPITATRMTRHNLGAALYAPLRVVLYETDAGEVVFEYDKPSSLFSQYGDPVVTEVGLYLDDQLQLALISAAS